MYDLVEWAADQPWSDGNVGMIGISYFAMTQLEAAVGQPPHPRRTRAPLPAPQGRG
jgi:predicted acyl esterase